MPPHLKRDGAYYRIQKRVPLDIMREVSPEARQRVLGTASGVFTKYLGSDLKDAKRRLPAELAALEEKFAQLRGQVQVVPVPEVTREHLEVIAWAELQDYKADFKREVDALPGIGREELKDLIEWRLDEWREGLNMNSWSDKRNAYVAATLAQKGINLSFTDPMFAEARRMIAVAILDAHLSVIAELGGNYSYAPSIPKRDVADIGKTINGEVPKLSVIHQRWEADRNRNPRTALEWATAVVRFVEVVGDKPVNAISKDDIRAYKDALSKAPTSFSKTYPGKTLPDVIELTEGDPTVKRLSQGTVAKYLRAIGSILGWAETNGVIDSNPMPKIAVDDGNDGKERLTFTTDDLNKLFGISVFTKGERPKGGAGEAAKYLPLLGLFTGARLEELGQAHVSDIRQESGIWYLDINELDEGKSLKTKASRRKVPLHPELIRCGFLAYVHEMAEAGEVKLFPLLNHKSTKVTGNWSKWFGRVKCDEAGIQIPARALKDFHSFRHGFKDACRAARVPEEVSDALTGHSGGGVGRRYGSNGVPLDVKADAIRRLRFDGLKLEHLYVPD